MPTYEVRITLSTNIETSSPEMAERIALEGVVALLSEEDSAEAEFNRTMPQEKFPRFVNVSREVVSDDTPTEDGLDNSEEVA